VAAPRVYLDEDVYAAVAAGLRRRGFDVLTTVEASRSGAGDDDQLRFAAEQERVIVTFNRGDFARLHSEHLQAGNTHAGIVVSAQTGIGPVVRGIAALRFA
jgi:hypothetical protein